MFTHQTGPRYPPQGYSQSTNMMARNTLPFPPGFSFYTTTNEIMTPVYPPGLHIDPDIVRRQVVPRFIPDFPLMSNIVQQNTPQYLPESATAPNSNMHNQTQFSLVQSYKSNIGTVIKFPSSLRLFRGVVTLQPSRRINSGIPLSKSSEVLQQEGSVQVRASEHPNHQLHGPPPLYNLLEKPTTKFEGNKSFAATRRQDPVSNTFQEKSQQQRATSLQVFINDTPSQRSSQLTDHLSEKDQLDHDQGSSLADECDVESERRKEQMLTETYESDLETEMISEDIPPPFDNWGLPNSDLMYYIEGIPDKPRMLDHEYIEENPKCILEISTIDALTFGTWTDWELNNRIQAWMIKQDFDGMTNSIEEVSTQPNDLVSPSTAEDDNLFFEDIAQVWQSVSSTEETAEHYQTFHEEFKQVAMRVIEYLEDEEDWVPGESSPDMARVTEEGW